jgi:tetratricopeptide (TPR) repeat protein
VGVDGTFCKHCVAVALAWMNRQPQPLAPEHGGKAKRGGIRKEVTLADAGKFLNAEEKDTLIRMMLDWAKEDRGVRERLVLYAARRSGPGTSAAAVRRAFENAVRVRDFVPYREAAGWARDVDRAIDSIEQLLNDGQAAAVIELCESALQSLLVAIQRIDDSDGYFGTLRDRLQEIHFRACGEARPNPVELATRLFKWELHGDFDIFYGAVKQYAEILADKGMAAYRALAEAEWKKAPSRKSREMHSESGRHFRITHIMESLAQASGDIDELVSVMSRDLSSAYYYWRIAEVYRESGQHDNALLWAEKGLQAFPDRTDVRLREFTAHEYHRRHRHADAMKLMWSEFLDHPWLDTYKVLEQHARKAAAWPEWRERALAAIGERIAKSKQTTRGQGQPFWIAPDSDNSLLVEIFLYESNPEEAWSAARVGGCSRTLWLRLAAIREKDHPEDAAPIYLEWAEAEVAATTNGRYEDSVALLVKAASIMRRLNRSAEFIHRLDALRVKYKIKRNFIKLIEQSRKSLYL